MEYKNPSRRKFLKDVAGATALAITPETLRVSPSSKMDKLNIACVGVGGYGEVDVEGVSSENLVAFCDVDERSSAKTYAKYPKVPRFQDYRKMFDQLGGQIDAVTITTPDHMHYPIARAAMELGKHVFVQKPLTHTIWEARELTQLARTKKVITQMGNQGRASEGLRKIFETIRTGGIGDVREVHVYANRPLWPQGIPRSSRIETIPAQLNWDLWQGVAPQRPFNSDYLPFNWRGWWDYGTGAIGDMGCHLLDSAFYALNLLSPSSVFAESSPINTETGPLWSHIHYKFPARKANCWVDGKWQQKDFPPLSLHWYDGKKRPIHSLPTALKDYPGQRGCYQIFIGDRGSIGADEYNNHIQVDTDIPYVEKKLLSRIDGANHYKEWIRACKGGPKPGSSFEYAGPLTELVLLGNIALRSGKEIIWDATNLRVVNDTSANRFITKKYRKY